MDFFHFIYNEEIKESAFNYLFSLCDSAEMLYDYAQVDADDLEFEALGTEYEFLIPAIIGCEKGESWGMRGRIYTFALTDEFKNFIVREGLSAMPCFQPGLRLENLTLLKDGKMMYAVCSHEGYDDFDDEFKQKIEDFCRSEIVKTKLYKEALVRYKKLPKRERNDRAQIRSKLYDLTDQVEDAWEKYVRSKPRWEMSYKEYLRLAKPVFSTDVYEKLEKAGSFTGLFPQGYPHTFAEAIPINNEKDFASTELAKEINKQLDMLDAAFFIEEGLDDWQIEGEKEWTPTIIMNDTPEELSKTIEELKNKK